MLASVRWINDYLDRPATAVEMGDLLTRAGFPIEDQAAVEDDVQLHVELTSNRGDCLSHAGLACEIAAMSGRSVKLPQAAPKASGPPAASAIKVVNREKTLCPLYTARIIRGVKVGPSPPWLAQRLRAVGQIPRNNVVDATNFVLWELGQPTHVFDLAKLKGGTIIIRKAAPGEGFLPIGEGAAAVKLTPDDLVIADEKDAVAMAGVKGGALSAVSGATADILLEAATFDHVAVRGTSRRHQISSDSSYRFERGVHPGQVNAAADRLAALILEIAGGRLCEGVVSDGAPIPEARTVSMRPSRCRALLGVEISDQRMTQLLASLGLDPRAEGDHITCAIPAARIDLEREVDLIEEVFRLHGTDQIPVADTIHVRVAPPQATELARRAVNDALAGMGFIETVTHTLVTDAAAAAFTPPDVQPLRISDARARAETILRPSILPSLLRVAAHNRDCGTPGVKLFETAATFGQWQGKPIEIVNLALLAPADAKNPQHHEIRGVVEALVRMIVGPEAAIRVEPLEALSWLQPGASITVDGRMLGTFGLLSPAVLKQFGLDQPLASAEIGLPSWYEKYPPVTQARALPAFPPIERDISAIVEEKIRWNDVESLLRELSPAHLESTHHVTTFRGKQAGSGRKSVTMRLRFRAADRTLTSAEAEEAVNAVIAALQKKLGAEVRR